jgi:hypothetical protein
MARKPVSGRIRGWAIDLLLLNSLTYLISSELKVTVVDVLSQAPLNVKLNRTLIGDK